MKGSVRRRGAGRESYHRELDPGTGGWRQRSKGGFASRARRRRRTWATLAFEAGIHPKVVSERLGQHDSITIDIDSHVTPTLEREAADVVAGVVFGG